MTTPHRAFDRLPTARVPEQAGSADRRRAPATRDDRAARPIDVVIDTQAVRTLFQPVIHLSSRSVAGFEALTRGPACTALESPMAMLDAARSAGRLGELDWLCRTRALRTAADAMLPEQLSWLVNVEPAGLAMACPPHLLPHLARATADLRVMLEIVERDLRGNVLELIHATDQARRDSWGVALDDVGAEASSLALLPLLQPDLVKLDMSLVRELPGAEAAAVTAGVRAHAERSGAVILAEGIENLEQERLATVSGATYGQGYFYGRPAPLPAAVPVPSHPIPVSQDLAPVDGRTPFEVLSASVEPQRQRKKHLLQISTHLEAEAELGASRASVLLAGFQHEHLFTSAMQARYAELASRNVLTIVLADGVAGHDEPRFHVGSLPRGSRLRHEWVVIVLNAHFAAAFVARDCGDSGPDEQRRFDFVYTHDRALVIDAARHFVQSLGTEPEVRSPRASGRFVLGVPAGGAPRAETSQERDAPAVLVDQAQGERPADPSPPRRQRLRPHGRRQPLLG